MSPGPAVATADGAAWRYGGDGDGQWWIVRDVDRRWYRDVGEVVAAAGDRSDSAMVIRPTGDAGDGLRVDSAGRLYWLTEQGVVLVACDPAAEPRPPEQSEIEVDEVHRRAMLPADAPVFALIGADARGRDDDVDAALGLIREWRDRPGSGERSRAPAERHLLAALDDPNPWIAETARRFVREGGPVLYPEATRRLAR
jgi:hypothetical protein